MYFKSFFAILLPFAKFFMVAIVQLVEHLIVVQDVAGSSPVSHPSILINVNACNGISCRRSFLTVDGNFELLGYIDKIIIIYGNID